MAWEAKLAGHPFLDYSQLADANAAKGELREAGWSSCRRRGPRRVQDAPATDLRDDLNVYVNQYIRRWVLKLTYWNVGERIRVQRVICIFLIKTLILLHQWAIYSDLVLCGRAQI